MLLLYHRRYGVHPSSGWQDYVQAQLRSLGQGSAAPGFQGSLEAQARGQVEQQFRQAEAIASRLRSQNPVDAMADRQQALLEALNRNAPAPEIRRLMAEIKLLEPDAYGTRAAVEGVVDYQQAITRGTRETYMTHPRHLPEDPASRFAVLSQEASASLAKMYGHAKPNGNDLSTVRSLAKYLGRVEHTVFEASLKVDSELIELKNLLMLAKHSDAPDAETLQALKDWAQRTHRGHLSDSELCDEWVKEAQKLGQDLVVKLRSSASIAQAMDNPTR